MINDRVIEDGVEIEFLNGIDGRLRGIVNGTPLVVGWTAGGGVTTYLPVFVASVNEAMYVNGENVVRIVDHSVRV